MATRINGNAGAALDLRYDLDVELSEDLKAVFQIAAQKWTYGTGANQVNCIYAGSTTLADDGTATIDLYSDAALLDVFKLHITMAAIKFLYIKNNSTDATLQVGGIAAGLDIFNTIATDIMLVKPGGVMLWTDPTAAGTVTTTNENIKILHGGTGTADMVVDIIAMGLD